MSGLSRFLPLYALMSLIDALMPTRAWSSLNATVGGRLRRAAPYARSCFSGSSDEGDCAGVVDEYLNPGMFFVSLPRIILR